MIIIDDKLISDEIVEKKFVCNLNKCKGACCWEGDFGAPLTSEEIEIIEDHIDNFIDDLDMDGQAKIEKDLFHAIYGEPEFEGTALLPNGACVFLLMENGIAQCGIEKANKKGKIPLQKPISCHLYPIRINEDPHTGTILINYDEWDICSDACNLGEELKVPVYKFVKTALIRRFGEDFYNQLDETANYMESQEPIN